MKLNELVDNEGSRKDRMRVGRGAGSGKGKTGGRGVKGQKSRTGVSINGFEGGQMPLYRRLPKRGFNNVSRKNFVTVNIGRVQKWVDDGKLDISKTVDAAALVASGLLTQTRDGVRLLGNGELTAKINFDIAGASKTAVDAVEKAGGSVTVPTPVAKKEGKRVARRKDAAKKREARLAAE